jgi:replicative DNA helicase
MSPAVEARSLPHDLETEKVLLGNVLLHSDRFFDIAHLDAKFFWRDAHRAIFIAMRQLADAGIAIDPLTLNDALQKDHRDDDVGGIAYLISLTDGVPRQQNLSEYAQIIETKWRLRQFIGAATNILSHAYQADISPQDVLDHAEQALIELIESSQRKTGRLMKDIMPDVMERIERWQQTPGVSGIASGFYDLDETMGGFQPNTLVTVGARPGVGKSSFALNVGQYAAAHGAKVLLFSLEMSDIDLGVRAITGEARIDTWRLRHGHINEPEWGRITDALQTLSNLNLTIVDTSVTIFEVRTHSRRQKATVGLDFLIVDYTQLVKTQGRHENRVLELTVITQTLKAIAMELQVPVLAVAQLSRKCEERSPKRPIMSDLRESGSLENDSDCVLLLYREAIYTETPENRNICEVIIAKNRNYRTGEVKLAWIPEQTRFANLADMEH